MPDHTFPATRCGPAYAEGHRFRNRGVRVVLTVSLLLAPHLALPVHANAAAAATPRFDIEPGPLDSRLNQFARAARVTLSFTPAQVQGRISPGLQGSFATGQGLERLLAGTGLAARITAAGFVLEEVRSVPSATEPGEPAAVRMDPVEVRADFTGRRDPNQAYREAGSSNYLSRDDIERNRGSSVGDIFRGTTGVLIGENRNSGGLDVNIRGMQGQGRVPILVDGARQETTVYRGYSGVASRSYVDPDLIGGIQIDKGPTMAAQGTGATGGLVQMRTLIAEDIVQPGETFGLRLRGQAIGNNSGSPVAPGTPAGLFTGDFSGANPVYRADCVNASICTPAVPDEWGYAQGMDRPNTLDAKSWAGSLAIAKRWERADLVAAYAHRNQGNYYAGTHGPSAYMDLSDVRRLPFYSEVRPVIRGASRFQGGERIPGTNYESSSGLLKGTLYLPRDQELELGLLRYRSTYSEIMPSQIVRFGNFAPISQPRNSEVQADTASARYRWNPSENPLVDLRANLWHTRTRATNNSPSATEANLYNNELERYRRWGMDVGNTSRMEHGGWGRSELRYGLAVQRETVGTTALTEDPRGLVGRSGQREEASVFAQWQYKPVSSVTAEIGVRHTRFRSDDDKPIVVYDPGSPLCVDGDGDGACDPLPNRNRQSGTAPVFSLLWEPLGGLQFYGRYAQALRMPSLFESTSGFSFNAAPDVVLKPERAKNREVGLNFLKDGALVTGDKLRLKLAYFRNRTTDYLTRTSPNLWEEGGQDSSNFRMRNVDSATFHGIELSGGYDLGYLFTELGATRYRRIEICYEGSYRIHACNDYGIANSYLNNMIPPKWHANATLGARLLDRKLVVGVRGIFMGQRTNAPAYNDDTANGLLPIVPWHAYRVFDLFASYRISQRVSVDFNLDNFTDRYYLDALGLGLIPAPGRTARLGVTVSF